ncbi:MAG TPA: hypothetical protein VGG90_00450, partial [Candidatus Dormibacteraeota bacterium]
MRFAALTATQTPGAWDGVVVAGLDGTIYNQASFKPLPSPDSGCGGTALLPPSAYIVQDRVYFADGTGTIRSLGISGSPTTVAQFPLISTQQLLSFAVSPDGKQVLATIATLPAGPTGAATCRGEATSGDSNYYYDVFSATSGGSSTSLSHQTIPANSLANHLALPVVELDGWSARGPFGSKPSGFAAGPWIPSCIGLCRWADAGNGGLWLLDPDTGAPLRVADADCRTYDVLAAGDYLCQDNNERFYVKQVNGTWRWTIGCTVGACFVNGGFLAPDTNQMLTQQPHNTDPGATTIVLGQDQSRVLIGGQFKPDGWFDNTTVAGDTDLRL